jgi:hypothetical protein
MQAKPIASGTVPTLLKRCSAHTTTVCWYTSIPPGPHAFITTCRSAKPTESHKLAEGAPPHIGPQPFQPTSPGSARWFVRNCLAGIDTPQAQSQPTAVWQQQPQAVAAVIFKDVHTSQYMAVSRSKDQCQGRNRPPTACLPSARCGQGSHIPIPIPCCAEHV